MYKMRAYILYTDYFNQEIALDVTFENLKKIFKFANQKMCNIKRIFVKCIIKKNIGQLLLHTQKKNCDKKKVGKHWCNRCCEDVERIAQWPLEISAMCV